MNLGNEEGDTIFLSAPTADASQPASPSAMPNSVSTIEDSMLDLRGDNSILPKSPTDRTPTSFHGV
ncbi:hypothetical protein Slin15195_G129070 [Septoria linicola]|uniref:Uncharacterized protein n=1 Tax=Septoria linicola TaxID=215465 RepID=A0A9Q9B5Y2_9PEZI|nr:hypothetical protein Slin14017_G121600 [Septoria linicola]USW59588.1 hypothetical protein Slin15195_G129070 [Septoria linicola]